MENPILEEKRLSGSRGKIFYYQGRFFAGRPAVVFLHGLSANHTTWLKIIKILEENQYNSLALDLRGHGLSDKTRKKSYYKIAVLSEDLKKIIGREKISKFILVGYSFGGSVALDYAAKNPGSVAGLILISANYVSPLKYKKINFLTPALSLILNLLALLLIWQKRKKYLYYRHGASRGYWHSVWIGLNTMPLSVNLWLLLEAILIDFKKALSKLTMPVLIVRGKNDPFLTEREASDLAAALPRAELLAAQNSSHFIASRSQAEVAQILLDFLKKI